jgi:hypothetical protein
MATREGADMGAVEKVAEMMHGEDKTERAVVVIVGELDMVRACRGLCIASEGTPDTNWFVAVQDVMASEGLITVTSKRGPGGIRMRKALTDKGRTLLNAHMPRRMEIWEERRF